LSCPVEREHQKDENDPDKKIVVLVILGIVVGVIVCVIAIVSYKSLANN
jgi:hypothetical protein